MKWIEVTEAITEVSAVDVLEQRTGSSWPSIRAARSKSMARKLLLDKELGEFTTSDSSIVVVGSLARQEVTTGSDVDWTLLLDGVSQPEHLKVAHAIRKKLKSLDMKQPGAEGVFGTIASSHDLIHRIGGQDDTNSNTTLRILLLLESDSIGRSEAYQRVLKNILWRYLDEDRGLWLGSGQYKVPRFLFNDVARYWRTMTVDFAYKQRSRQNEGFAIRNLKLRISRKLIFLAGMVACFECHTNFHSPDARKTFYHAGNVQAVIDLLKSVLAKTPLEIVAAALVRYPLLDESSQKLFKAYDAFLEMLSDDSPSYSGKSMRDHLDQLPVEDLGSDEIAKRGRDIAHDFGEAIAAIFLSKDNELGQITIEYGVF